MVKAHIAIIIIIIIIIMIMITIILIIMKIFCRIVLDLAHHSRESGPALMAVCVVLGISTDGKLSLTTAWV